MTKIAHIWKYGNQGWLLEISECAQPGECKVLQSKTFSTKLEAKQYAHMLGAKPWNY